MRTADPSGGLRSPTGRLRPLEPDALRDGLREMMPAGAVRAIVKRRVFKRRQDWRGERLFERVVVESSGGGTAELCLKSVAPAPAGAPPGHRGEREARAYRFLNRHPAAGAPVFHGRLRDPAGDRTILVLEYVRGRRLKKVTDPDTWRDAAAWLGGLHAGLAGAVRSGGEGAELPRRDAAYYRRWVRRAASLAAERAPGERDRLEALVRGYGPVAGALAAPGPTLVHGELYCTNVMLREQRVDGRFCPFDWETASLGCGTLDVAYLGRQDLGIEREDLLAAYAGGWGRTAGEAPSMAELRVQHAAARVHERVYILWSACAHRAAPPEKVRKYLEKLDRLLVDLREARSANGAGGR